MAGGTEFSLDVFGEQIRDIIGGASAADNPQTGLELLFSNEVEAGYENGLYRATLADVDVYLGFDPSNPPIATIKVETEFVITTPLTTRDPEGNVTNAYAVEYGGIDGTTIYGYVLSQDLDQAGLQQVQQSSDTSDDPKESGITLTL